MTGRGLVSQQARRFRDNAAVVLRERARAGDCDSLVISAISEHAPDCPETRLDRGRYSMAA